MKNKKILLILAAVIFILGCSNENSIEKNNIKKRNTIENIKNSKTEKEYLKIAKQRIERESYASNR